MKTIEWSDMLRSFESIALKDTKRVQFLKRCDFKYVLPYIDLLSVLSQICDDYYVMNINAEPIQQYKTTYFDTPDNFFYNSHHNDKNNRIKIRKREYLSTGERYFEIKKKSHSGYVNKKRMNISSGLNEVLSEGELQFASKIVASNIIDLKPTVTTQFKRITLVSKRFDERVTIDCNLSFENADGKQITSTCLSIIEVKCDKHTSKSVLRKVLRYNNVHSSGFSKYCIGRALLDEKLKRNNFKQKLKLISWNY